jgi:hypothetical protein
LKIHLHRCRVPQPPLPWCFLRPCLSWNITFSSVSQFLMVTCFASQVKKLSNLKWAPSDYPSFL